MTNLKGGYILINKTDADIYASVEKALTQGKPILFYEDANTCYYIDTISKSGDDIVLTKGGKTITITDANVVTESGDIQPSVGSDNIFTFDIDDNDIYSDKPNYVLTDDFFNSLVDAITNGKLIYIYNSQTGDYMCVIQISVGTQGEEQGYSLWVPFIGSIFDYEFETQTKKLYFNAP